MSPHRVQIGESCSIYAHLRVVESMTKTPLSIGYWGVRYYIERLAGEGLAGSNWNPLQRYGYLSVSQIKVSAEFRGAVGAHSPQASDEQLLETATQMLELVAKQTEPIMRKNFLQSELGQILKREVERLTQMSKTNQLETRQMLKQMRRPQSIDFARAHGNLLIKALTSTPGTYVIHLMSLLDSELRPVSPNQTIFADIRKALRQGIAAVVDTDWNQAQIEVLKDGVKTLNGKSISQKDLNGLHALTVVGFEKRDREYHYQIQDSQTLEDWAYNISEISEKSLEHILRGATVVDP